MTANNLPPRLYYRLDEAAQLLGCTERDLIHLGGLGLIYLLADVDCPGGATAYVVWLNDNSVILDDLLTTMDLHSAWTRDGGLVEFNPKRNLDEKTIGIKGLSVAQTEEIREIEARGKATSPYVTFVASYPDMERQCHSAIEIHTQLVGTSLTAGQLRISAHQVRRIMSGNVGNEMRERFGRLIGQAGARDSLPIASAYASFESHAGRAPYLAHLISACHQFWSTYDPEDPTTAPTNAEVQDWLSAQGVAERVAEVMAQILRPEGLPSGPRRHKRRG